MSHLVNASISYICNFTIQLNNCSSEENTSIVNIRNIALSAILGLGLFFISKIGKDLGEEVSVHYHLNLWANDTDDDKENLSRLHAGRIIFDAYRRKLSFVKLNDLGLSSIPSVILALKNLETLDLRGNNLDLSMCNISNLNFKIIS